MGNWNNIEERQHINISEKTYEILLSDIEKYNLTSFSTITNLIIENGCLTLPANPINYLKEQEAIYNNILSKYISDTTYNSIRNNIFSDIKNNTINTYKYQYCKNLKGVQKNIHYSKRAIHILQCCDDIIIDIYKRPGKFVNALFESFADLKDTERDKIIKKDIYENICDNIKNNTIVLIEMFNHKSYFIQPISIENYLNYTYVICKSCDINNGINGTYIDMNPRLSNIISVTNTFKTCHISDTEKTQMLKKIKANGAAYFYSDSENIKVELTDTGVAMYNTILHQRPAYTSVNGNIYTFNCTQRQAFNYFFKFGSTAKIIATDTLKEKFATLYEQAYNSYKL